MPKKTAQSKKVRCLVCSKWIEIPLCITSEPELIHCNDEFCIDYIQEFIRVRKIATLKDLIHYRSVKKKQIQALEKDKARYSWLIRIYENIKLSKKKTS